MPPTFSWAEDEDDDVWPSSEEAIASFMLAVQKRGKVATYALARTSKGWSQRFVKGDDTLRGHNCEYMKRETLDDLRSWWRCEFDHTHMSHFVEREVPVTEDHRAPPADDASDRSDA